MGPRATEHFAERISILSQNLGFYRKPSQPTVFVATLQYNQRTAFDTLLVRTNISPASMLVPMQQIVASLGQQYVFSVKSLAQSVDQSIAPERTVAMLSSFFGALALLLAAIGLYGLMSYNMTRRTRELGIRFALGAQRKDVFRIVLRETLAITLAGVVLGLPCALATTHFITHMLFWSDALRSSHTPCCGVRTSRDRLWRGICPGSPRHAC